VRSFSTTSYLSLKNIEHDHEITLLPGDGIGPEVADAAKQITRLRGLCEMGGFRSASGRWKTRGEFPASVPSNPFAARMWP